MKVTDSYLLPHLTNQTAAGLYRDLLRATSEITVEQAGAFDQLVTTQVGRDAARLAVENPAEAALVISSLLIALATCDLTLQALDGESVR